MNVTELSVMALWGVLEAREDDPEQAIRAALVMQSELVAFCAERQVELAMRAGLNWFWMFQNYHSIHHLFPRVPFYKYAELFEEIEDVMVAKQAPIYNISVRGLKQAVIRV